MTGSSELTMGMCLRSVSMNFVTWEIMICVGGGVKASSIARIKSAWKKFRKLLTLLTLRGFSLCTKKTVWCMCEE